MEGHKAVRVRQEGVEGQLGGCGGAEGSEGRALVGVDAAEGRDSGGQGVSESVGGAYLSMPNFVGSLSPSLIDYRRLIRA